MTLIYSLQRLALWKDRDFSKIININKKRNTNVVEEILRIVSSATGFSIEEIAGKCQKENLVAARAYITRRAFEKNIPHKEITYWLNRDRCSLIHYMTKYKPNFYYNLIEQWTDRIISAL